jgi:hypothetical protein
MIEMSAKISSILYCIIKYILLKMYVVEKKSQGGSFYNMKLLGMTGRDFFDVFLPFYLLFGF